MVSQFLFAWYLESKEDPLLGFWPTGEVLHAGVSSSTDVMTLVIRISSLDAGCATRKQGRHFKGAFGHTLLHLLFQQ